MWKFLPGVSPCTPPPKRKYLFLLEKILYIYICMSYMYISCIYAFNEQSDTQDMSDSLIKNQISDLTIVTDVKQKNWQVNMIVLMLFI